MANNLVPTANNTDGLGTSALIWNTIFSNNLSDGVDTVTMHEVISTVMQSTDSIINVNSAADLPSPSGGVITLDSDNVTYRFNGSISIGADRINITGTTVRFEGTNAANDSLISTNANDIITANNGFVIANMSVVGMSANRLIYGLGTGVEGFLFKPNFIHWRCRAGIYI